MYNLDLVHKTNEKTKTLNLSFVVPQNHILNNAVPLGILNYSAIHHEMVCLIELVDGFFCATVSPEQKNIIEKAQEDCYDYKEIIHMHYPDTRIIKSGDSMAKLSFKFDDKSKFQHIKSLLCNLHKEGAGA